MLLARLVVNPHSGFSEKMYNKALLKCIEVEITFQQNNATEGRPIWLHKPEVARILFTIEPQQLDRVWSAFFYTAKKAKIKQLTLEGCGINDVRFLTGIDLEILNLAGTAINDLSPLSNLINLQRLYLTDTEVRDISPLSQLKNLQELDLIGTKIGDLSPLYALTNLQFVFLLRTNVSKKQISRLREKLPNLQIF